MYLTISSLPRTNASVGKAGIEQTNGAAGIGRIATVTNMNENE